MLVTRLFLSSRRNLSRAYSQPQFSLPEITKATQHFAASTEILTKMFCELLIFSEEYQKAVPLLERSVQVCEQVFGPKTSVSLSLSEMIGEANLKLGKMGQVHKTVQLLLERYKER